MCDRDAADEAVVANLENDTMLRPLRWHPRQRLLSRYVNGVRLKVGPQVA